MSTFREGFSQKSVFFETCLDKINCQSEKHPAPLRTQQPSEYFCCHSGEGGIRTPGTLASTSVFETDPFNHSGTSPTQLISVQLFRPNEQFADSGQARMTNSKFVSCSAVSLYYNEPIPHPRITSTLLLYFLIQITTTLALSTQHLALSTQHFSIIP